MKKEMPVRLQRYMDINHDAVDIAMQIHARMISPQVGLSLIMRLCVVNEEKATAIVNMASTLHTTLHFRHCQDDE